MMDRRSVALVQAACADLLDRLGSSSVSVGQAAREAIGGGEGDDPVAVVRPGDARDVSVVLRVARSRHLPVICRARLPAQHPTALRGAIVLDASGLDRPPAIDTSRQLVTVGAAVPLEQIDRAARRARLALRAMPAWAADEPVAAWIGAGAGGELGLGLGELGSDLVSATLVAGSGRIVSVGASELLGAAPAPLAGSPDATPLLLGAEGRLGVLVDITLRLWPAPWTAWAEVELGTDRAALLATLSAGRQVCRRRLADTVLIEQGATTRVLVRACTLRGDDDVDATTARIGAVFAGHGLTLGPFVAEPPRARIGQEPPEQPWSPLPTATHLDMRVAWPDAPKLLDVLDALGAEAVPVPRRWALGQDGARVRLLLPAVDAERHAIVRGAAHWLDAGAVPTRVDGALRELLRERMPSTARVLLTSLARAFDPDDVMASARGVY